MKNNLAEIFKIMRDIDRMKARNLFPKESVLKTRGHRFKGRGARFKRDISGSCFRQRAVYIWKELPEQ